MFFLDIADMWVSIADGIAYGWEWLSTNFGVILEYFAYLATGGGVLTGAVYLIKIIVPLLKNSNKPVLKELATILEQNKELANKQEVANQEIQALRDENKTLKEYLLIASEANERNIMLSDDMRTKFGYIAEGLKNTENQVAIEIAENIEEAIEDETLTQEEIIEIADSLPVVEDVLGMSLKDIELEIKGE
jgi:hypothetical protein